MSRLHPSPGDRPDGLLTLKEAAAYLGRRPCTLYRWRWSRRRNIPHQNIAGRIFYRRADLDRFLAEAHR